MFVLVTILGAFLAWIGYQVKWIRDRHEALKRLSQNGFWAANDGRTITIDGLDFGHVSANTLGHAIKSPWSLRPFFERGVSVITIVETSDQNADNAAVQELSRLFPEAEVQKLPNTAGKAAKPVHYEEDAQTGVVRRR